MKEERQGGISQGKEYTVCIISRPIFNCNAPHDVIFINGKAYYHLSYYLFRVVQKGSITTSPIQGNTSNGYVSLHNRISIINACLTKSVFRRKKPVSIK